MILYMVNEFCKRYNLNIVKSLMKSFSLTRQGIYPHKPHVIQTVNISIIPESVFLSFPS